MAKPPEHAAQTDADAIVEEYLRRVDAGEQISKEMFLAQHPQVAPALESFFANEQLMRKWAADSKLPASDTTPKDAGPTMAPSIDPAMLSGPTGSVVLPAMMGRYRIEKELGRGAMGAVYRAHDIELDRPVALKIPHFGSNDNPELISRFLREARSAAVLAHPNICRVYDVSEFQGTRYIAMEYIDGRPLSAFINSKGVPPKQAAAVIRKLALGLAEAHKQGIIHRDLKPDNILINQKGEPVLTDFGLARETAKGSSQATQDGVILGSPAYMPPEQAAGNLSEMGPTSDVYSLGVVLYQMLTGDVPFRGSVVEVLAHVLMKSPKTVKEVRPDIDPALAALCDKMMSKKSADRYSSMTAVAAAINDWQKTAANPQTAAAGAPAKSDALSGDLKLADPAAKSKLGTTHTIQPKHMISPAGAKPGDGVAGTKPKVPERTPRQLQDLAELVDQLLEHNDYLEAIRIVEELPDHQRTPELRRLLGEGYQVKSMVEKLERQLEKFLNLVDIPALKKCVDQLLKLRPSHPRGKEIRKALNTEGRRGVLRIRNESSQFDAAGSVWEPWKLGIGLGVLLVLAVVSYFAVTIYIKGTMQEVIVEIDDPTAVVKVDGKTVDISGEGTGRVKLTIGDHDYTATSGDTSVTTNGNYTVQKNGSTPLKITLKPNPGDGIAGTSKPPEPTPSPVPPATPVATTGPPLAVAPFDAAQAKAHQEAWAEHLGVPVEYTNSLGMKFRLIPPGDFLMGTPDSDPDGRPNEKPQHKVRLTKPFYFGMTEVTQPQWTSLMNRMPWEKKSGVLNSPDAPASWMSVKDALEYCRRLTVQDGCSRPYRLPTEAEWEFAARAGTTYYFGFSDNLDQIGDYAWTDRQSINTPHPVGTRKPNAFGLHDMIGNVWEMVSDRYSPNYQGRNDEIDPTGPEHGNQLLMRGGGYVSRGSSYRPAVRDAMPEDNVSDGLGLRVILPVEAVQQQLAGSSAVSWKPGFLCQIYGGTDLKQLLQTRVDRAIGTGPNYVGAFNASGAGPGLPVDQFSIRWLAAVQVKQAGTYTLRLEHDDGGRLWIDDQLLIDKWQGGIHHDEHDVALSAGWHTFRVEYYEDSATCGVNLRWKLPGQELESIQDDIVRHNPEWTKWSNYTKLGTPDEPATLSAITPDDEGSVTVFVGHTKDVYGVAAHPDGRHVISASWDGTVRGWDVSTGQEVMKASLGPATNCFSVAVSPDGRLVAVGGTEGQIHVYEFPSGQLVHSFDGDKKMIQAIAFATDSQTLFTGSVDASLLWWNLNTGKSLKSFRGNTSGVASLAVTPDGKEVLSGGGDGIIRVGTIKSSKLRTEFTGHEGTVLGLAVSPDGELVASGGIDQTVRVRRIRGKKNERELHVLKGHTNSVAGVAFLPDGKRVVSAGFDKQIIVWDLEMERPIRQWQAHKKSQLGVRSLVVLPNSNSIVTGGFDALVRMWDVGE